MLSKCCCFWKKKETLLEKRDAAQWYEIAGLEEKLSRLETKISNARDDIVLNPKQEKRVLEISQILDRIGRKQGDTITVANLKAHVKTVSDCDPETQMQLLLLFEDCCLRNEYLHERSQIYQEWKENQNSENIESKVGGLSMPGNP